LHDRARRPYLSRMNWRGALLFLALCQSLISPVLSAQASVNAQEGPRLFAIQPDGTGLRELKGYSGPIGQVRFSPDGSKLVIGAIFHDLPRPHCFAGGGAGPMNGKLFLMNTDGSDLREVGGYLSAFNPSFTADGKRILFTAFDESAGTCHGTLLGIYSVNVDGTDAKLIIRDATDANLSSDGSKLVYRKALGLYLSNGDSSNERLLGNLGNFGSGFGAAVFNPADSSEIMLINTLRRSLRSTRTAWRAMFYCTDLSTVGLAWYLCCSRPTIARMAKPWFTPQEYPTLGPIT
jgi:Tol biopolymer transport system component